MKTKYNSIKSSQCRPFSAASMVAVAFLFGVLSDSAQSVNYLYSGSKLILSLNAGTYDITAIGARGGFGDGYGGGGGAEMKARFNFATAVNLTLLVGGAGSSAPYDDTGGGGGGGSFVVNGATPLVVAGGGGADFGAGRTQTSGATTADGPGGTNGSGGGTGGTGGGDGGGGGGYSGSGSSGNIPFGGGGGSSFLDGGAGGYSRYAPGGYGGGGGGGVDGGGGGGYSGGGGGYGGGGSIIDSSAITNLAEISWVNSPDDYPNGEIIITAVQITQPQVPPPLLISSSGSTVTVSWQNVFAWSLQQNSNLANPVGWTACSGITSVNGTNYLSVTTSSGSSFFRLQEQ